MEKAIRSFLLLGLFLGFVSCEVEESPPKPLGPFKTISANGLVDFTLVEGPENKVISTSLSDSYYSVNNGQLFINGIGNITIAVKSLYLLSCNGCDVKSSGPLTADTLNFSIHGGSMKLKDITINHYLGIHALNTGTYELSGKAAFLNLSLVNSVGFKGYDLVTDSTYIRSDNFWDCEVHATQVINAFVNSNGNVKYKGNPPVVRASYTGRGRLIAK